MTQTNVILLLLCLISVHIKISLLLPVIVIILFPFTLWWVTIFCCYLLNSISLGFRIKKQTPYGICTKQPNPSCEVNFFIVNWEAQWGSSDEQLQTSPQGPQMSPAQNWTKRSSLRVFLLWLSVSPSFYHLHIHLARNMGVIFDHFSHLYFFPHPVY